MRTIKFRAKRIDNGEWVYGHYYENMLASFIVVDKIDYYVVDKSTLWQFTGLKDKKGVEIYENDIVRIVSVEEYYHEEDGSECDEDCKPECKFQPHGVKTVVEWKSDWGGFMWSESDLFDGEYTMPFSDLAGNYTFEVIGNVTDNKELLS